MLFYEERFVERPLRRLPEREHVPLSADGVLEELKKLVRLPPKVAAGEAQSIPGPEIIRP